MLNPANGLCESCYKWILMYFVIALLVYFSAFVLQFLIVCSGYITAKMSNILYQFDEIDTDIALYEKSTRCSNFHKVSSKILVLIVSTGGKREFHIIPFYFDAVEVDFCN